MQKKRDDHTKNQIIRAIKAKVGDHQITEKELKDMERVRAKEQDNTKEKA